MFVAEPSRPRGRVVIRFRLAVGHLCAAACVAAFGCPAVGQVSLSLGDLCLDDALAHG